MYCKNCGAELKSGALFCSECGERAEVVTEVVEQPKKNTKVWDIFGKIGFIGGLVCFILSFIPFIDLFACSFGIYFIVFSALGKKTSDPGRYVKAVKGLKFSIAGTIIGFVTYIIYMLALIG